MDLNNKTAVITGVSTGIGKELVLKLLKKGVNVAGWGLHRPDFEDDHFKFYEVDIRNNTLVEDANRKTT
ncbi:MAG: short-chain dehydrogenase, partial [Bacteroidetes bacterium]|nr:short-chain dehydrogenase [Bacteroidota bacterium]